MAAEEENNKKNEGKGFAGLSSLVSDVDTTPPPPAPKTESAGSTTSTGRPASQSAQPQPQQPTQRQTYQEPPQPSSGSSGDKWLLGLAAVVGLLWLIGQSDKNTPSPAPAYSPPAQTAAPRSSSPIQPQAPSRPTESRPPVGQNLVFTREQIRYCLAEDIRMDGAKAALNYYSDSDVDRLYALVADYNSRCGSFRYRSGALESARRDVEPYRSLLQAEGRSRFARSSSTGSMSAPAQTPTPAPAPAPAPATGQWQQPQAQDTPSDADLEKQHWDYIHARVPDANKLIADPRLLPWVKKSPMRQRYYEKGAADEVVQLLTDFKLHLASLPQHAPVTAPARPAADETVRAVQQKLNELGYSAGPADGLMGRSTRSAISDFQRDTGISSDGVASSALLARINAATRSSPSSLDSQPMRSTADRENTIGKLDENYSNDTSSDKENYKKCIDGRYPSLCDHSLLTQTEAARVDAAERKANFEKCIDGRYPSLCDHSLLTQAEAVRVAEAERRARSR